MKKILILMAALVLITGFAIAEDIGLTAGLEGGVYNATKANDGDMTPFIMPYIYYDNSFGDLDVYAELDYEVAFDDDTYMGVYFDLDLAYNLSLGSASTLSFLLEDYWEFYLAPEISDPLTPYMMELYPGVKFNQEFDFGSLYAKAQVPMYLLPGYKDADFACDLWFTAGWKSTFGLGIYVTEKFALAPDAEHSAIKAVVNYGTDTFNAELKSEFIGKSDIWINLTPKFEYYFNAFTFYVKCDFTGIGTDFDVEIKPTLGVTFSF